MKIAIIGAGAAGLASLKHSLEEGYDCEVYEQTDQIGGTWVYREETGMDSYGLPIHSSMYSGLVTNLPKEAMSFEGFPYKEPYHSYISHPEVLDYITKFCKTFNLLPHIKFFSHVEKVSPIALTKWLVTVRDLKTNSTTEKEFDAVIVCVGNYSVPLTPHIAGMDIFEGTIIHSHNYRITEPYANRNVLILGSGPSGTDIARLVAGVANKVYLSYRSTLFYTEMPKNVIFKPPILRLEERSVIFENGTEERIDDIIFCTGYCYDYPFLTPQCGIEVDQNWVKYIYKHIINIKHPTMAFIGIPSRSLPFPLFGIQVRFFLAYLRGNFNVSQEDMLKDVLDDFKTHKAKGLPQHCYHRMSFGHESYSEELVTIAKIPGLPKFLFQIYKYIHEVGLGNRSLIYKIINDNEFEVIKPKNS